MDCDWDNKTYRAFITLAVPNTIMKKDVERLVNHPAISIKEQLDPSVFLPLSHKQKRLFSNAMKMLDSFDRNEAIGSGEGTGNIIFGQRNSKQGSMPRRGMSLHVSWLILDSQCELEEPRLMMRSVVRTYILT